MFSQVRAVESHRSPDDKLRGSPFPLEQPHQSMRGPQAFHQISQHLIENPFGAQRLCARGRQQGQSPQFVIQLVRPRPGTFKNRYDHCDSKGHCQQMIKRNAEGKDGVHTPQWPVHSVKSGQKKNSRQELGPVPAEVVRGPPQEPSDAQGDSRHKHGSLPPHVTHQQTAFAFQVKQADRRNAGKRKDLPRRSCRARTELNCAREKEDQREKQSGESQGPDPGHVPNKKNRLRDSGNRQARPSPEPRPKIASAPVAPQQNQQNE